jgi:hypothetical protein
LPVAVDSVNDNSANYLLDEYEHVAEAHFQTITSISAFFKHYLVIMAVPITVASLAQALEVRAPLLAPSLVAAVLLVVAFVGLFVFVYIVNLRLDVMLYARTINAIRRYFMDRLEGDPLVGEAVRVLPKNRHVPPYHEVRFFYPVALSFALINGSYLALGISVLYRSDPESSLLIGLSAGAAFATVHLLAYLAQAQDREGTYLAAKVIGVDLDGVVNLHREQFCMKLLELKGKVVEPEHIDVIPVHLGENNTVTQADEHAVFNSPDYWTDVAPMDRAASVLRKLQDELGYEVRLFTNRDWPKTTGMHRLERKAINAAWATAVIADSAGVGRFVAACKLDRISALTRRWLKAHGMDRFPLTVEKGRRTRWPLRVRQRNRFAEARNGRFHIFIEDDPRNAARLAQLCDIVLLVEQPYNCEQTLPRNVIRVSGWDQVWSIACGLPASK